MRVKTTHVFTNSQDPESRPPLTLSPLAIEDLTDEPVFALTDQAKSEMAGQTLLDALTAFDWRAGDLAKDLQTAQQAYKVVQDDTIGHDAYTAAREAFDKACRALFFNLHTMTKG